MPDDDPLAEQTLDSRIAFEGVFLRLFVDHVRTADGHESTREYVRHPGAVMMIPLLDDGQVVLERQYRYPLGRSLIEFPAGKIDPGEALLECARREVLEVFTTPWRHLHDWIADGTLTDVKTIVGTYWLERALART